MIDVVVVGAGLGGLMAAAKLAGRGKTVAVVEKKSLPGGTSAVFRRAGYAFPMGPLATSYPGRVHGFLDEAGIREPVAFRRVGFELRTPFLSVMLSKPLADLEADLAAAFPSETDGLAEFFRRLAADIEVAKDMDLWHPEFRRSPKKGDPPRRVGPATESRTAEVRRLDATPSADALDWLIGDEQLRNFLGSMGTGRPEMSRLNLALMWNVMAGEGIWFPSCGIHGIADLLRRRILDLRGEVLLAEPVRRILIRKGRAAGVVLARGLVIESRWVVSNADYKTTFLDLLDSADIPAVDLAPVRVVPYTDSEFCVYAGIVPERVDLNALHAEHLFYRKEIAPERADDPEDFDNREIEVCHWSRQAPELAPAGRAALVLRTAFPYEHFAVWRTGERERKKGYSDYKRRLAEKLIRTAESIVPGLAGAVEVMEAATPLTYRDWGNRFRGSIAGWSWAPQGSAGLPGPILVRTPVPGLLTAGAYAASELFLGGVPTALWTGSLAADYVLAD
jgi:phytoene dehydrogenase-like protein